METLGLAYNNLTGSIGVIPSMAKLKVLYIRDNLFTGLLPRGLSRLQHCIIFDVQNNKLTKIEGANDGTFCGIGSGNFAADKGTIPVGTGSSTITNGTGKEIHPFSYTNLATTTTAIAIAVSTNSTTKIRPSRSLAPPCFSIKCLRIGLAKPASQLVLREWEPVSRRGTIVPRQLRRQHVRRDLQRRVGVAEWTRLRGVAAVCERPIVPFVGGEQVRGRRGARRPV
jgi:hypothetical protein